MLNSPTDMMTVATSDPHAFISPFKANKDHALLSALDIVPVHEDVQRQLFDFSLDGARSELLETRQTLANLRKIQPSIADLFELKDSTLSKTAFKLIIERSLASGIDSTPKSYIAVSYCWHSAGWNPVPGHETFECGGRM